MAIAHSKVTTQGQISVPVEVLKRLRAGPGSVLEWVAQGDQVVVRRAGRYSSEEIHQAIFSEKELTQKSEDVKVGMREYIRKRHARD